MPPIVAEILEIIMVVSFGASWPFNVIKSFKARTAKGKSPLFLILILFGYVAGIASKFCNAQYMANFASKWYVLVFYILNFIMVATDLILYIRNCALDKQAAAAAESAELKSENVECTCECTECECENGECDSTEDKCECKCECECAEDGAAAKAE